MSGSARVMRVVSGVAALGAFAIAFTACGSEDAPQPGSPATTTTSVSDPACPQPLPGSEIVTVRTGGQVEILDAPGGEPLGTAGDETELGVPTAFLVAERDGCWLGVVTAIAGNDELGWVRFDVDTMALTFTRYSLHADLSERRLELRRGDRVLDDIIVTVGSPATPTPTGRFAVTGVFAGKLNPLYGCCAISLSAKQPTLPADWPGGDTIAIHGWNGLVGEAASNGCLRATDYDMRNLLRHAILGMPIEIVA